MSFIIWNITCSESDHPTLYDVISNTQRGGMFYNAIPVPICRLKIILGGPLNSNDSWSHVLSLSLPTSTLESCAHRLLRLCNSCPYCLLVCQSHFSQWICGLRDSGFCHYPNEICNLLGYYTTQSGNVGQTNGPIFLEFLTLEGGTNRLS